MMSIESLEKEIKDLEEEIEPLVRLRYQRSEQLRKEKSKMFIKLHNITKDSVQRCDDKGMPWLGHVKDFGHWLSNNSSKPWCCWNGILYRKQEIVAGIMQRNPLGRYEDLPELEEVTNDNK